MNSLLSKFKEARLRWFLIALVLTVFGLMALYSIGSHAGGLSASSRFLKQLLWLLPSLGVFLLFFGLPKKVIHKYAYLVFALAFASLFMPYITGQIAGTYRWISFGGIRFQPVEVMKWAIVIALARYLSDYNLKIGRIRSLFLPIAIVFVPMVLIVKQPDLGSAIIISLPVLPLLYWVGAKPIHIFLLLAPLISVVTAFNYYTFTIWIVMIIAVLYLSKATLKVGVSNIFTNIFIGLLTPILWGQLKPYQQERLLVLLDVSRDPQGASYQVIQSQTAIGSGGFWGKGLGKGTQTHLKFLPEQETDFIFSVIGEELGFVAVCIVLVLFAILLMDLIKVSYHSSERFSSLILIGIATIFLSHVFVNIGMTINLLPVKGLPLPFLSYGGSFLLSCYAMLGLATNMSVETIE